MRGLPGPLLATGKGAGVEVGWEATGRTAGAAARRPRALRLGGRAAGAVIALRGRPGPGFSTGAGATGAGGSSSAGCVFDGAVAIGSTGGRSTTSGRWAGVSATLPPTSSSSSWAPVVKPGFRRTAVGRASYPSWFMQTLGMRWGSWLRVVDAGQGASKVPTFGSILPHIRHFASGSGLICRCTARGLLPLPPSINQGVRSPLVVHRPRPFQPALASSMRPSSPLA